LCHYSNKTIQFFVRSLLSKQHFHDLNKLKLLSVDRTLVLAYQLYFFTSLLHLPLDYIDLENSLFLCASYLQTMEEILVLQWKYFFRLLRVQEKIHLTTIDNDSHSELASAYICEHTLTLRSYTVVYDFKKNMTILYYLFWKKGIGSENVVILSVQAKQNSGQRSTITNMICVGPIS
jgi:hypothetical protein